MRMTTVQIISPDREIADFRSDINNEDVNVAVTSNHIESSSGFWMKLIGQLKGAGLSCGTVPGQPTEMSIGVGPMPTGMFWEIMTGTRLKVVISELAKTIFARAIGWGFGGEPSAFFHLQESSVRTNAADDIVRIDTNSPNAQAGFGGGIAWYANGQKVGALYGLITSGAGGLNSGRFDIQTLENGVPRKALSLEPNGALMITAGGVLKLVEQGPPDSAAPGYRALRVIN